MFSFIIIQLVYCYDSLREESRIVGTGYRTASTDYTRVSPLHARLKKNTGLLELKITFLHLITIHQSHALRHLIRVVSSDHVFFPG